VSLINTGEAVIEVVDVGTSGGLSKKIDVFGNPNPK
jgi:hypothetical protein